MSSNDTSNANNQGGGGGGNTNRVELILAIVALVIAIMAMVISIFQALQQYYASAQGYSSCSEKVIGKWSAFRRRKFLWKQFRFEVRFNVPVIFVSPPTNTKGPLGSDFIKYLDGTKKNYEETHVWLPEEFDARQDKFKDGKPREAIHTAENELATWLALLMALQRMEYESRLWHKKVFAEKSDSDGANLLVSESSSHYRSDSSDPAKVDFLTRLNNLPKWDDHLGNNARVQLKLEIAEIERDLGISQIIELQHHTMAVGMQEKTRSWDTIPDGMKKPYATTTICHLIEIMAMLGIYWREFDRSKNIYRAQGNGFSVTGAMVSNFGIVFSFEKVGKTWFQSNRVVPNDSVKQLCFGFCPTIFNSSEDGNTKIYTDEPKDASTLQLASPHDVAETLVSLGCNTSTVDYFRFSNEEHQYRYYHLFPIAFEMLGMVGKTMQIRDLPFTMIPNPTFFTWNKLAFSLVELLSCLRDELQKIDPVPGVDDKGDKIDPVPEVDDKDKKNKPKWDNAKQIQGQLKYVIERAKENDDEIEKNKEVEASRREEEEKEKQITEDPEDLVKQLKKRVEAIKKRDTPEKGGLWPCLDEAKEAIGAWPRNLYAWVQTIKRTITESIQKMIGSTRCGKAILKAFSSKATESKKLLDSIEQSVKHVNSREKLPKLLEQLHEMIASCDGFLLQKEQKLVKSIFALHIQEVLSYLNSKTRGSDGRASKGTQSQQSSKIQSDPRGTDKTAKDTGVSAPMASSPVGGSRKMTQDPVDASAYSISLGEIDEASWKGRHRMLVRVYVGDIRERIIKKAIETGHSDEGNDATDGKGDKEGNKKGRATVETSQRGSSPGTSSETADGTPSGSAPTTDDTARAETGYKVTMPSATTAQESISSSTSGEAPKGPKHVVGEKEVDEIWRVLVIRMVCWLMLHDFHKKDRQTTPSQYGPGGVSMPGLLSGLYDSRLPVYIV